MDMFEVRKEGLLILELKGRLDALTSPGVRDKILTFLEAGETNVLLDCSGMDYVSSAGLRVLFEAAYKARNLKGWIGSYGVCENVKKIFNLADLSSELPIFRTQEEALKSR